MKGIGSDDDEGINGHYKSAERHSAGRSLGEKEALYSQGGEGGRVAALVG